MWLPSFSWLVAILSIFGATLSLNCSRSLLGCPSMPPSSPSEPVSSTPVGFHSILIASSGIPSSSTHGTPQSPPVELSSSTTALGQSLVTPDSLTGSSVAFPSAEIDLRNQTVWPLATGSTLPLNVSQAVVTSTSLPGMDTDRTTPVLWTVSPWSARVSVTYILLAVCACGSVLSMLVQMFYIVRFVYRRFWDQRRVSRLRQQAINRVVRDLQEQQNLEREMRNSGYGRRLLRSTSSTYFDCSQASEATAETGLYATVP